MPTGETYVPTSIPRFTVRFILNALLYGGTTYSTGYDPHTDLTCAFRGMEGKLLTDDEIQTLRNANSGSSLDYMLRRYLMGKYWISEEGHVWLRVYGTETAPNLWTLVPLEISGEDMPEGIMAKSELSFPSATNFDFMDELSDGTNNQ